MEVVRTPISAWPISLAEERLNQWAGGNPGTLVFAATWSPSGELVLAYEIAPRPQDTTGDEVVRYLWFFVDPSSPVPLQTLVFMGDSPLIYWRQFNRPVSELIGVDSSLLARETEMDKEFANSVATAIAKTTATAVAAGR